MSALQRKSRLTLERLEERIALASVTQLDYFETWDGAIPSTDGAGIGYHAPTGNLYLVDSEINEIPGVFNGNNLFELPTSGDILVNEYVSNNSEPTGITYSVFDGFFYVTNDNTNTVSRYDENFNNPLVVIYTTDVASNIDDPEGITSDPAGNLYVSDGDAGTMQILKYDSNLQFVSKFSIDEQAKDAEGIAYDPNSNNLFIVSGDDMKIFEYSTDGVFLNEYEIGGLSPTPISPQGLTFAPTSDPNDAPNRMALFLVDAMIDNFPDGAVYEIMICNGSQNCAPQVSAGADQSIDFLSSAVLAGTIADDGLPQESSAVTTTWTQVSGPGIAFFSDPRSLDATASFSAPGSYVLRLTADDGERTSSDEMTVFVMSPNMMLTTVEVRVAAKTDDAEQKPAGRTLTKNRDLELVFDKGVNQIVGMRFDGLNIPQGSMIANAYIQFQADETNTEETRLRIQGEDVGDATTFSDVPHNITMRTTTSNSVPWSPPPWTNVGEQGPNQRSSNILSLVQEIVNRPDWSSGNAMVLIATGSGERVAESYDGKRSAAPLLHVEYATFMDPNAPINLVIDPPSSDPNGAVQHAGTNTLFVVDDNSNRILEFSAGGQLLNAFDTTAIQSGFDEPKGISYDPVTGNLFVADDSKGTNSIYVLTTGGQLVSVTDTEMATANQLDDAEGVAYDAATRTLYVAFENDEAVGIFNVDVNFDLTFLGSFSTLPFNLPNDRGPNGIAFDPSTGNLFLVTGAGPGSIVVEVTPSGTLLRTFHIHLAKATGVDVLPNGNLLFANSKPGNDGGGLFEYTQAGHPALPPSSPSTFAVQPSPPPLVAESRVNSVVGDHVPKHPASSANHNRSRAAPSNGNTVVAETITTNANTSGRTEISGESTDRAHRMAFAEYESFRRALTPFDDEERIARLLARLY